MDQTHADKVATPKAGELTGKKIAVVGGPAGLTTAYFLSLMERCVSTCNRVACNGALHTGKSGLKPTKRMQSTSPVISPIGLVIAPLPKVKVTNPAVIEKFEQAWGVKLNTKPGTHATDVFHKAIDKEIRGLFIFGENPVVTDADTNHIKKALSSLDFGYRHFH